MTDVEKYKAISKSNLSITNDFSFPQQKIKPPSSSDYKSGLYYRLFCLRINDGSIVEIPERDWVTVTSNPLYTSIKLKWKISGTRNNVFDGNILTHHGVEEHNISEIQKAKRNGFKNIDTILKNPLQYWRGY